MSHTGEPTPPAVSSDEVVYRSIWLQKECFKVAEDGSTFVSPQAFADRSQQVSLSRHILCDNPPLSNPPRLGNEQVVARLSVGAIREANPLSYQSGKKSTVDYVIDVISDVTNGHHISHALVISDPAFETQNVFKKLKLRLAHLVEELSVPPPEAFIAELRAAL